MLGIITRIEEILEAESVSLRALDDSQIRALNERKSRALLEFSRTVRTLTPDAVTGELRTRIQRLHALLEENKALIALHLKAARDIADLVSKAIQDSESDGTYSSRLAPGSRSP